jgi:predicted metal-dependent phosphoesterase TrpH
MRAIAVTDHDTTAGVEEALEAAQGTDLTVIPGVEISTDVPGVSELHILGYYIDWHYAPLQERLRSLRASRLNRARKMVERLAETGLPLQWEKLLDVADSGTIGRPHVAQAMVDAEYVDSVESAFALYIGRGAPAYVERDKLAPEEAIRLIRDAGGAPVLAHPRHLIEHLPALVKSGLAGLEVWYNGYEEPEKRFLAGLAAKHGIIATGGSDYHGSGITSATDMGQVDVPDLVLEQLAPYADRWPSRRPGNATVSGAPSLTQPG